jgi:hypothetical protein
VTSGDGSLRNYLLGRLSEEEATALEERFFSEEAAFDELLLAEDDLIDDYLDEQLSVDDRRGFEERMQERPELVRRLEARRVLTRALRRRAASTGRRGWRFTLLGLAAAAAVALVVYRVGQHRASPEPKPPVTVVEHGTAPATPPVRPADRPGPVVLLLGSAGVRGSSTVPTTTLEADAASLLLRWPLAPGASPRGEVVIEDVDRGVVFRGPGAVTGTATAPHLETEVPAATLRAGDYLVRYGDDETFFRIRR